MRRAMTVVLAAAALGLGACNVRTATAPGGDLTVHALFDDVQDLTPGHDVQVSNVVVGSVRRIELDGHRARVSMSIVDGRDIPVGTAAVVRHTSVLGEAYVDLVFPAGFDPASDPVLADDALIADTDTEQGIEQLAGAAAGIVGALAESDLAALVESGAAALDGRGGTVNQLLRDAGSFVGELGERSDELGAALDQLGRLGAGLAPDAGSLGAAVERLAETSGDIAAGRDRAVAAVEGLLALARSTSEVVLGPHADRLSQLVGELEPLLGFLADRTDVLVDLLGDLDRFTRAFPTAVYDGQVLLLAWAFVSPEALQSTFAGLLPLDALAELLQGAS